MPHSPLSHFPHAAHVCVSCCSILPFHPCRPYLNALFPLLAFHPSHPNFTDDYINIISYCFLCLGYTVQDDHHLDVPDRDDYPRYRHGDHHCCCIILHNYNNLRSKVPHFILWSKYVMSCYSISKCWPCSSAWTILHTRLKYIKTSQ